MRLTRRPGIDRVSEVGTARSFVAAVLLMTAVRAVVPVGGGWEAAARGQAAGQAAGQVGFGIPSTTPPAGLREATPRFHVLVGATVVPEAGAKIEDAVVVVRDGVIVAVGPAASTPVPVGARRWEMKGKTIYPGLIDAYSEVTEASFSPAPVEAGTKSWNPRVTPQLSVAAGYRPDRETNRGYRQSGVVARLIAPGRGVIKGRSAVVDTSDQPAEQAIVAADVAQHMALQPGFGGRPTPGQPPSQPAVQEDRYPTSPMGAFTLVRQTLLDAQWYAAAWKAVREHAGLPSPEKNAALEVLAGQIAAKAPLIIDAPDELYALRAHRIGEEFGLPVIVRGSGQEFRLIGEIAKTGRAVIVPLSFPRAPAVGSPEQVANVSLMNLMAWDIAPENPARLHAAGVTIAFTTQSLAAARGETLLGQVRKAVARGLPKEAALRAMTVVPATLYGVGDRLGTIAVGKAASLLVTDGDLFAEKTKVMETWVDGDRFEITAKPTLDARGRWKLSGGDLPAEITLTGEEPGRLSAEVKGPQGQTGAATQATTAPSTGAPAATPTTSTTPATGPSDEATEAPAAVEPTESEEPWQRVGPRGMARPGQRGAGGGADAPQVSISDTRLTMNVKAETLGMGKGTALLSVTFIEGAGAEGETAAGELRGIGTLMLPDGTRRDVVLGKLGPASTGPSSGPSTGPSSGPATGRARSARGIGGAASRPTGPSTRPALFAPNWPLGEYGRAAVPEQRKVLLRNATVWTGEGQGTVANASVLVENGKISEIYTGKVELAAGVEVIDCTGKHVTAGIIDAHSHMATDGGVNESGQTITAEVRIGDFVDPTDISIYRQLAGGVTSANILHGSANTIGGQNQVVKLRWGAGPEAMKFEGAPAGIKFALGENPKQSNWGDTNTTRYPQTRMGVEQIVRDEFMAARDYRAAWRKYEADPTVMLPPRKDLELEAVAEILEGKRWIHSHAYRQDEMLALLRTTKEFGVTIGSFQHVLEGYKIADEFAKAGVTASGFTDWWAFKFEVYDAIPYSPAIMWKQGVVASLNSDDAELATRLNQEAAKAVKYGAVPPDEAWKMVTLNPAKSLRIDDRVGSIKAGKDADLVVWSGPPMSTASKAEQTWIDGRLYWSLELDAAARKENARRHAELVQRILAGGEEQAGPGDAPPTPAKLWPNHDEFCGGGHSARCESDCQNRLLQAREAAAREAERREGETGSRELLFEKSGQ